MKNFLIKLLGGYTKQQWRGYCSHLNEELRKTVEMHQMQNAWEQLKQEKRRLH